MPKRQTINERLHGSPPNSAELIALWNSTLINRLLGTVWEAYDDFHQTVLSRVPWTEDFVNMERSISQDFELAINRKLNGFLSVDVQHGRFEEESRSITKDNAQPPQYDIAFIWNADLRIMWPLEAKVLKSDASTETNLGNYVETLKERFLTGYYAPFSNGGAMVAYLKSGNAETVIENIATRMGCTLTQYPQFPVRCHKTSDHQRTIPAGKDYPVAFRCHHLILPLSNASVQDQQPAVPSD